MRAVGGRILEYFEPAFQLGMTATPKRKDNIDTYAYFGNPDLYLQPPAGDRGRIPRTVPGPSDHHDLRCNGMASQQGRTGSLWAEIPDEEYQTKDFERVVALRARTKAIARSITDFLKRTDRFAKTIVFCVDQEHADEMRRELNNLNADLVQQNSNYVCRVTADEGSIGRGHLDKFRDVETDTKSPIILTTSQLLTTGVNAPTCKNIVLARVVNSMVEFKQIIGRGTRLRDDYGKFFFNIIDFTQSTRLFADPEFDGDPARITEIPVDDEGAPIGEEEVVAPEEEVDDERGEIPISLDGDSEGGPRQKYYVDGGSVEIAHHLVYELDPEGKQLRVVKYTDYTADKVRTLFTNAADLRKRWADAVTRNEIIETLEERGIDFEDLADAANQPEADPFDLLCHIAFNAPLRTRRERAERLRTERKDFFEKFGLDAKCILEELLEKYTEHGTTQFAIPDILEVPPISQHGNVIEIATKFGGVEQLREAVNDLQTLLYEAA